MNAAAVRRSRRPRARRLDAGQDEVQARFDEAAKKGYFGHTPDDTPNANYTLAGVHANKPTPENQRGK